MTEQKKFLDWYENEKKKGLVDIKFDLAPGHSRNPEDIFRELNQMVEAMESGKEIDRGDVF